MPNYWVAFNGKVILFTIMEDIEQSDSDIEDYIYSEFSPNGYDIEWGILQSFSDKRIKKKKLIIKNN